MLGFDIILYVAVVQITCEICYLISTLLKVLQTFIKKLVIIGFETDFSVLFQKLFVHLKLFVVCKPAFFMLRARPRITEINVKPFNFIVCRDDFVELFNVVIYKQKVCNVVLRFAVFFKQLYDCSPADTEHINFYIESNYVFIGIFKRKSACKSALTTADFKIERLFLFKSLFPLSSMLFRIFYEEVADGKLGLCPFLFSYSHISSFVHPQKGAPLHIVIHRIIISNSYKLCNKFFMLNEYLVK